MTQDITSLIEKLEGAEVGSRELDREVWLACRQPEKWGGPINPPGKGVWEGPHVSYSLDAALALAERVLPGWRMHALQDQQGIYQTDNTATRWAAGISEMRGPGNVLSYAPTPSLAVCASILKARAQSEAR